MDYIKPLSDHNLEELLRQLEIAAEGKEDSSSSSDFILFVSTFDLKAGKNPVHQEILNQLYRSWSQEPCSAKEFYKSASLFFPKKNSFYQVNSSTLNLTQHAYKYLVQKNVSRTKSKYYKHHFESFLKYYDIKPGTKWIELYSLSFLYDKWLFYKTSKTRLNATEFNQFLKLYLTHKRSKTGNIFSVDPSIKNHLSDEVRQDIKQGIHYAHRKQIKTRQENKQKKLNEVSGVKPVS